MERSEEARRAEANRLYWSTDLTVAEVGSRLGVSSGTLYGLVDPEPAGARCPDCDGPLVFTNRTARLAALASCELCGEETQLDDVVTQAAGAHPHSRPIDRHPELREQRVALAAGALLLGLAAGALAVILSDD
ncbi:MAG: hypothetical protein ACRELV_07600 [Longimicrobiales bacterium]